MKDFEDFIKYVSSELQEEIMDIPLEFDGKINITSAEDLGKLISANNIRTLRQVMCILSAYHEWANS